MLEQPRRPIRLSQRAQEIALARDARVSRNGHIAFIIWGRPTEKHHNVHEASEPQPLLSRSDVVYNDSGKPVSIHTVRYRNNRKILL